MSGLANGTNLAISGTGGTIAHNKITGGLNGIEVSGNPLGQGFTIKGNEIGGPNLDRFLQRDRSTWKVIVERLSRVAPT